MNQSYKSLYDRISVQKEFRASALHSAKGKAFNPKSDKWENVYSIYSYSTCIAEWFYDTGNVYFNDTKYSITTTRHQNRIHATLLGLDTVIEHTSALDWQVPRATSGLAWKFQATQKSA